MSLNARISLSAIIVLMVFIGLTAYALERAFIDSSETALRDTMSSQLYALMAAAEVEQQQIIMPSNELDALLALPESGIYATISHQTGEILWQSSSALGINLPISATLNTGEKTFNKIYDELGEHDFYTSAYGVSWPTEQGNISLSFRISTDLSSFNKQISQYRNTLWSWLMAMALLLLVSQAIILRWGLAPLRQVAAELNRIESGKQQQIERAYPQEIKRLSDNINTLLQQERQQKSRYRDAMGNLAHSLKTPLAVLQTSLQSGSNEKQVMQEQLQQMDAIVKYQLNWAVTSNTTKLGKAVNISTTVQRLLNSLQKVYSDKNIQVKSKISHDLTFKGDEGDLMEVLGNLLDNAFKWARSNIQISAEQQQKGVLIKIIDDGIGIAESKATALLQRGARIDESVTGQGIGLSIVHGIVQAYGGEFNILKGRLGGVEVRVYL